MSSTPTEAKPVSHAPPKTLQRFPLGLDITAARRFDSLDSSPQLAEIASSPQTQPVVTPQARTSVAAELRKRCEALQSSPVAFIPSDDFSTDGADAEFLGDAPSSKRARKASPPAGLPAYLGSLYTVPLLSPEQEYHQFRRFNYLKYKASSIIAGLKPKRVSRAQLELAESLLAAAEQVRNDIVKANLRLVVANARMFTDAGASFDDLVSDGNVSLLQAVEKFDYGRGFRFSTYATHAIRRTFYRRMTRRQRERTRLMFAPTEMLQEAIQPEPEHVVDQTQLNLYQVLVERMGERLSERELLILKARYCLDAATDSPTLQVLAEDLGICKERVRQLQSRAIDKLRQLAIELQIDHPLD